MEALSPKHTPRALLAGTPRPHHPISHHHHLHAAANSNSARAGRGAAGGLIRRTPTRSSSASQADWSSGPARTGARVIVCAQGGSGVQAQAQDPTSSPEAAWQFLREFTKQVVRGTSTAFVQSPDRRAVLRQAFLVAYTNPYPPAGWAPSQRQAEAAVRASSADLGGPAAAQGSGAPSAPAPEDQQRGAMGGGSPSSEASTSGAEDYPVDQEVMFGIVAGNVRIAVRALRDWCQALGLPYVKPASRVDGTVSPAAIRGGVYLKYNAKSRLCYVSAYESRDKGVLVQMGQEQLGHFPLGLFDEAMQNPEPIF